MKLSNPALFSRPIMAFLFVFSWVSLAQADEFKLASVNVTRLLNEFHLTKSAEAEDLVERKKIKEDDKIRIESIKALGEELKAMEAEFQDTSISEEKRKAIGDKARVKQNQLAAAQRERQQFLETKGRTLNVKMVGLMDQIREEVAKAVNDYAAGTDFTMVVDESGMGQNKMPIILHLKKATDITEEVLKILNKDAPATVTPEADGAAKDSE